MADGPLLLDIDGRRVPADVVLDDLTGQLAEASLRLAAARSDARQTLQVAAALHQAQCPDPDAHGGSWEAMVTLCEVALRMYEMGHVPLDPLGTAFANACSEYQATRGPNPPE